MTIQQPTASNTTDSPDHSLSHRVLANDNASPVKSVVVDYAGAVGVGTETPNSKLQVDGPISTKYIEKAATYTIDATDSVINCTANTFTITLPTAVSIEGRVYLIKNTGTGIVTVDGNGNETLDGELTQTLNQWDSITIISNGANWLIT